MELTSLSLEDDPKHTILQFGQNVDLLHAFVHNVLVQELWRASELGQHTNTFHDEVSCGKG